MARRISVPLLLDLVLVDYPAEIRELNDDPRVTRRFRRRGRLVNRVLQGRLLDVMHVRGALLPALAPHEDAERAERQRTLEQELNPLRNRPLWTEADLAPLAAYVRGKVGEERVGPAVQQLVGRLFVPDYRADEESYRAAKLVDAYPGSNPLRALWWRLSGRLGRARDLLWDKAKQDRHAIHATTIALHNIVYALRTMRDLAADPGRRLRAGADSIVQQCLSAPPRLLRRSREGFATRALPGAMPAGALIVFNLNRAHAATMDADLAFMTRGWSRCPAHAFVPALLRAVWEEVATGGGAGGENRP